MFVIELVYKADLSRIDAHMAAHMKFLKKYYASGHFVVSGRKIPRDGGIILDLRVGEAGADRKTLNLDLNIGGEGGVGGDGGDVSVTNRATGAENSGVLVTTVHADSPALHAGLKAGDVITAVDGRPVDSTRDLMRAIPDGGGTISLTIVREKKETTLRASL